MPKISQGPIENILHWGHTGENQLLSQISDAWWPKVHGDVTLLAQRCRACRINQSQIKQKTLYIGDTRRRIQVQFSLVKNIKMLK